MRKLCTAANSYSKIVYLLIFFLIAPLAADAQSMPYIHWEKTFGGSKNDDLTFVHQTLDGGYICGGFSDSGKSKDKASAGFGSTDYWVFRLKPNGDIIWEKTFGGENQDICNIMVPMPDGGFLLGGSSKSGRSEHKSQPNIGNYDFWIIRLDQEGNIMWDRTFGGSEYDFLYSIQATQDGGYILGGFSESGISGDKTVTVGNPEYWILKLDAEGNKLWDKTLGEAESDAIYILKAANGGYYLGGGSPKIISVKEQEEQADDEFRVAFFDENGTLMWEKSMGGNHDDFLTALQPTPDGGCVVGGVSNSGRNRDKSSPSQGQGDFWIVKLDAAGQKKWDRTYGGRGYDYLSALEITSDSDFMLGGISSSSKGGDKTHGKFGKTDFWLIKINSDGDKVWDETYGGTEDDALYTVSQTSDGGFIIGGISNSPESSSKKSELYGNKDMWILKMNVTKPSWDSR